VVVARTERRHHEYTVEEIRERLHARAAEALAGEPTVEDVVLAETAVDEGAQETLTRRVALAVGHVRTRLGLRRRPTPRRA
jgi:Cdc6-like AAA superfamily ATPase